MDTHNSPWLAQLADHQPSPALTSDLQADIVIVGGGISGISTALYLLQYTTRSVTLIEANQIAHGATGHNAGILYSGFEKPYPQLIREFGPERFYQALQDMDSSWQLLDDLYYLIPNLTPYINCPGYIACQSIPEIIAMLDSQALQPHLDPNYSLIVATEVYDQLPHQYQELYTTQPHQQVLNLLQTNNPNYIAAQPTKVGLFNSALFCHEVFTFMQQQYPHRFQVFEQTPILSIDLQDQQATLQASSARIKAKQVILCTNGYESFSLSNHGQPEIQQKLRGLVRGLIGYVAAYPEVSDAQPTCVSYESLETGTSDPYQAEPYFYFSRRPITMPDQSTNNLIIVAGPEDQLLEQQSYASDSPVPSSALNTLTSFVQRTYAAAPETIDFTYQWHGLMGYTPNGMRLVGPEPLNSTLFYNLGCNGIGLLPAIFGGYKISQLINGALLPPSIFDVPA